MNACYSSIAEVFRKQPINWLVWLHEVNLLIFVFLYVFDRFVTGPPNMQDETKMGKVPRLYINTEVENEECLLLVYRALSASVCLLINCKFCFSCVLTFLVWISFQKTYLFDKRENENSIEFSLRNWEYKFWNVYICLWLLNQNYLKGFYSLVFILISQYITYMLTCISWVYKVVYIFI